jgi:hypothetical protein
MNIYITTSVGKVNIVVSCVAYLQNIVSSYNILYTRLIESTIHKSYMLILSTWFIRDS